MQMKRISRIEEMIQKMDELCRIKKKMQPMRECVAEVLHELQQLRQDTEYMEGSAGSFEYQLGESVGRKMKIARAPSAKSIRDEGCRAVIEQCSEQYSGLEETARRAEREPRGDSSEEARGEQGESLD